jgi:hypothetical protein
MSHSADHGEAISNGGHVEIAEQNVELIGTDLTEGLGDRGGGGHPKLVDAENGREGKKDHLVVVHDEDSGRFHVLLLEEIKGREVRQRRRERLALSAMYGLYEIAADLDVSNWVRAACGTHYGVSKGDKRALSQGIRRF